MTMGTFWAILGAALAAGLSSIGSAIGVSVVGKAAAGATAENPDQFAKLLVLQLLPGTHGIYGLLIAFLVFIRLDLFNGILGVSTAYGLGIFAACLPVALVGLISAIYQAKVSVSSIAMLAKRPEESGKGIILTVMVETYSVLALLISFLGVYIPTVSLA